MNVVVKWHLAGNEVLGQRSLLNVSELVNDDALSMVHLIKREVYSQRTETLGHY